MAHPKYHQWKSNQSASDESSDFRGLMPIQTQLCIPPEKMGLSGSGRNKTMALSGFILKRLLLSLSPVVAEQHCQCCREMGMQSPGLGRGGAQPVPKLVLVIINC